MVQVGHPGSAVGALGGRARSGRSARRAASMRGDGRGGRLIGEKRSEMERLEVGGWGSELGRLESWLGPSCHDSCGGGGDDFCK